MSAGQDDFLLHMAAWPLSGLRPGLLGVAVSGGGDSMALLDLMGRLARQSGFELRAVTVDHGLRPEAATEAALVARYCAANGIGHDLLRWSWDGQGNLQARARQGRYAALAAWAQERGADAVALGHTQDDQAETFLMRLARQPGSDGLRAMDARFERHGATFLRPLLGAGRAALRSYLQRRGIAWAEDASNSDAAFLRVRARRALAALAPLGIEAQTLAGTAHNLAQENALLREAVAAQLQGLVRQEAGALSIARADFAALHPEVQRRLGIAAAAWLTGGPYPPRGLALAEFLAALSEGATRTMAGMIGFSASGRIWLARELRATGPAAAPDALWDGRWRLHGPAHPGAEIRALGPGGLTALKALDPAPALPALPRRVLLSTPALWQGGGLIAAPLAGLENGWRAEMTRTHFHSCLLSH